MQKEIFEQPAARATPTLRGSMLDLRRRRRAHLQPDRCGADPRLRHELPRGHGGALLAREPRRHPLHVEIASEYRYRETGARTRARWSIAISQSGETADTLAALEHAQSLGQPHSLAICNVRRVRADRARPRCRFLTRAGPEIGVASTKAFTAQLTALLLLALTLAKTAEQLAGRRRREMLDALQRTAGCDGERAARRARDRGAGRRSSRAASTRSSSAAACTTRSPWKAR